MVVDPYTAVAVALLAGCLLASAAVWGRAGLRWSRGQPLLPAVELPPPKYPLLLVCLVVAWIGLELFSRLTLGTHARPNVDLRAVQTTCLLNVVLWGIFVAALSGGRLSRLVEFGLRARPLGPQLRDGLLGFVASVLPVFVARLATLPRQGDEVPHAFLRLLQSEMTPAVVAWLALAAVVLAPLTEELLYRVILQGWLETKLDATAAIGITAVFFAGVHGFPDALGLFPLALVLGYVYSRRRSYLAVVFVHMLFNAGNLTLALLTFSAAGES